MFTFLFTSKKRTIQTGIYIWPEGQRPLWRAKAFCSTGWAQEKETLRAAKLSESERMVRGRIFCWYPFVYRLPVNLQLQEKSKVPPEITWVAALLHNCLRSCFLFRGYCHCEYGDKESWWSGTNRWQHIVLMQKKWGNNAFYHQSLCPNIFFQ